MGWLVKGYEWRVYPLYSRDHCTNGGNPGMQMVLWRPHKCFTWPKIHFLRPVVLLPTRCVLQVPTHSGRARAWAVLLSASCRGVWTRPATGATPATWWWTWCPSCRSSGMAAPCLCWGPSQRARSRTGGFGRTWTRPVCTSGCPCLDVLATAAWFSSSCGAEEGKSLG